MSHTLPRTLLLLLPLALAGCSKDQIYSPSADNSPAPAADAGDRRYSSTGDSSGADSNTLFESPPPATKAAEAGRYDQPAPAPQTQAQGAAAQHRELQAYSAPAPAAAQDLAEASNGAARTRLYEAPPLMTAPTRRYQPAAPVEVAPPPPPAGEGYTDYGENSSQYTAQNPVSTFSLDVDTGSYSNVRRFLNQGQLPPREAVRVEELLNYFSWDYPAAGRGCPFAIRSELGAAPWNPQHMLLRVGVKAVGDAQAATLPPANLVFLVDVSGSMEEADKLPLVRNALKMLTTQLRPEDHVALVTYADGSGVLLPPTSGADKATILAAIDRLQAGGGTNGGAGIQLAYEQARAGFIHGGVNRILLATDGDFNVGITDMDQLKAMITQNRRSGIALTTLGVGQGNYQEPVMQQLADVGNGNYAYLDSLDEARKVLLEQMGSTLQTVAADVKLQMEFNPQQVASWRLIGYEKRQLNEQDFRNDHVDAGEVGAGKSVVALYELTPAADAHRYSFWPFAGRDSELGYLKIRYKSPDHKQVHEVQRPLRRSEFGKPGPDWRFAAAVAGFGEHLRGDPEVQGWGWDQIRQLARQGVGRDDSGYRQDFLHLVDMAAALQASTPTVSQADPPDEYPE